MTMNNGITLASVVVMLGIAGFNPAEGKAATDILVTEVVHSEKTRDEALISAVRAFIPTVMKAQNAPGLNIALARHGHLIWEAGFGFANLEHGWPMTPETVFHSGSMGKTYTGTAIMQLVERGVVDINERADTHLPFAIDNPLGARPVTVHDLLTHQSGLAYGDAAFSSFDFPQPLLDLLQEAYSREHHRAYSGQRYPLWDHQVGEVWNYSNTALATLGLIVELANPEGLSFSDYIQQQVMDPLGMRFAQYPPVQDQAHVRPDIWQRMSTGYTTFGSAWVPTPPIWFEGFPAGAFVAAPGDHIRLLLAYLNKGSYNGHQLLKPATVDYMLTPQFDGPAWGSGADTGIIWQLADRGTPTSNFNHGGAHMYGWRNTAMAFENFDVAVVVATNHWALPAISREVPLITRLIGTWLSMERAAIEVTAPSTSWAWKIAYVSGLLFVESINGAIGVAQAMSPELVMETARLTVNDAYRTRPGRWDPEGFLAGVGDLQGVAMTPEAISDFANSDKIRVPLEERLQIYRELGGNLEARSEFWRFFVIEPLTSEAGKEEQQ